MKIVEIRNNLIKVEFGVGEGLILGRFIALTSQDSSYVAQIVNLKSDGIHQYAIAKLLFTFTKDGVVDNYDGSLPDINSQAMLLKSQELLDLLPVETPLYIGHLAQEDVVLKVDISILEHHLTIFSDHDDEKKTFIANIVSQLSRMGEKGVIFETNNIFENFPKIVPGIDFKIPLNSEMIDYIYDYDLSELNIQTKAVIKDIFYAVQQYIDTLEGKFLPIDKFVEVVKAQYEQMHMPELALLQNKLIKYRDMQIFANTKEELQLFSNLLKENSVLIVDLLDLNSKLQNKIISSLYSFMSYENRYVYVFLPVTDENSDKKLLKKIISSGHIFTLIFANHLYKYALELKEHAQNVVFFAPQTVQHEFAVYNTFLNKLNHDEFIIYGKLTHGVPFIVQSEILEDADSPVQISEGEESVDSSENSPIKEEEEIYVPVEEKPQSDEIEAETYNSAVENDDVDAEALISENNSGTNIIEIKEETDEEDIEEGVPLEIYHSSNSSNNEEIENILAEEDEIEIAETGEDSYISAYDDETETIEGTKNTPQEEEEFIEGIFGDSLIEEDSNEILENEATLTNEDLDFLDENIAEEVDSYSNDEAIHVDNDTEDAILDSAEEPPIVPVYPAEGVESAKESDEESHFSPGDVVSHPRYGNGTVEKIIKYGNKTLCSVLFDNVGRRLLDPSISDFDKI